MTRRQFQRQKEMERQKRLEASVRGMRKHLSADALLGIVRRTFENVQEPGNGKPQISVADALMSGFAVFSLKSPSLLSFERGWKEEDSNLKSVFKINKIPSDTQMRDRLDLIDPDLLRPAHNGIFNEIQRGKALEKMQYLEEGYILANDATGYFSSEVNHSPFCLEKKLQNGKTLYYLSMQQAALVHPDRREVIPLIPEVISRQDGDNKNDCESNASKRLLAKLHTEHPHLKLVVTGDGLYPNGPFVRFVRGLGYHFILGVKETDHAHLFAQFDTAAVENAAQILSVQDTEDPKKHHFFRWVNGLEINSSNRDVIVNVLEYWQVCDEPETSKRKRRKPAKPKPMKHFCWVTDIGLSEQNVYRIMRAARAQWKIENETFNTLKNQGYNFEHNYGLGQLYLSMVFVSLMMLAFLADQTQQLCCALFQAVWEKLGSKRALWQNMRSLFDSFKLESMEMLYRALLYGFVRNPPVINTS